MINGDGFLLRKLEAHDATDIYRFKNDPSIGALLGGFHTGMSVDDVLLWIKMDRERVGDMIWAVADRTSNACLGHVGFYKRDHRVRSAEFAILLGEPTARGKGLGGKVTRAVVEYGFQELNLNRISLTVLAINARAIRLYESVGFRAEGIFCEAQYKNGAYLDVLAYSLLKRNYPIETVA